MLPTVVIREIVGRRSVLAVAGEIDPDTVPALADAIQEELASGAADLWIDLTATDFFDASGIHALLAGDRRALDLNRRFAVICPAGNVRRVLELVGVGSQLPVFDDRAAAHRAG